MNIKEYKGAIIGAISGGFAQTLATMIPLGLSGQIGLFIAGAIIGYAIDKYVIK